MSALFKTPKINYGGGMAANNDEMIKIMQAQNERNNELFAQRQADIMEMDKERLAMEQAQSVNVRREEQELLSQAQAMEDAAQQESEAMMYNEGTDSDIDNVITGFYGSLYEGQRPE